MRDVGAGLAVILVSGPTSVIDDRSIASLNDPDAGVIATVARPATETRWSIGIAILQALGQRRPTPTPAAADYALLGIWLQAYYVSDVIVHHADRFEADVLVDIDSRLRRLGVELWAVVEVHLLDLAIAAVEDASGAAATTMTWPDFMLSWADRIVRQARPAAGTTLAVSSIWDAQRVRLRRAVAGHAMDLPYLRGNFFRLFESSGEGLRRVRDIVQNLRDFARLDEAEFKEVDFNAALRSTLEALRHEFYKKEIRVETNFQDLSPVTCHAGKMNQTAADKAEEFMDSPIMAYTFYGSAFMGAIVFFFVIAVVLWIMTKIVLKFDGPFTKVMEAYGLASLIGVLGTIITLILMNVFNSLYATPSGSLFVINSYDKHNAVHNILASLNIFTLWEAGVLGLGLAKISHKPASKGFMITYGTWAIYAIVSAAFGWGMR